MRDIIVVDKDRWTDDIVHMIKSILTASLLVITGSVTGFRVFFVHDKLSTERHIPELFLVDTAG